MLRLYSVIVGICLISVAVSVKGMDYPVEWAIPPNVTSLSVNCGDTISLEWSSRHDIAKTTQSGCPTASSALTALAPISSGGTYTYTVKSTDSDFYLICTVSDHCSSGQSIKVSATCPASGSTDLDSSMTKVGGGTMYHNSWKVRAMPNLSLKCGDDIHFSWDTAFPHGIIMKPYNSTGGLNSSCLDLMADNKTKIELVDPSKTGNYTWTPTENGDYVFLCPVGQHCASGQRFKASVTGCKTTSSVFKPATDAPKSHAAPQFMVPPATLALLALVAALCMLA